MLKIIQQKEVELRTTRAGDEYVYREDALGQCDCGEEIFLSRFTNTCPTCGRDYDSAGNELAPREQWGCDTGETVSEILMIK